MTSAVPAVVEPMLATPDGGRLPNSPKYAYEYKYDGFRAIMRIAPDGSTALNSRNGKDFTDEFAVLADGVGEALGGRAAILDGEIVVLNEHGQPDFALLQERRGRFQRHQPVDDLPVRYLVFDLLRLGDIVLLNDPYDDRRGLLELIKPPDDTLLSIVPAFPHDTLSADGLTPQDLLDRATAAGYEGLLAKERRSRYYPGKRRPEWLKHPLIHTQEVVVCGWRPGKGRRSGTVGALLLGAHDASTGELRYLGDVGTGFTDRQLDDLHKQLLPLERRSSPFPTPVPRDDAAGAHWVEPRIVGEVVYRQLTRLEGRLRHTSWRGLRPDREPTEIKAPS